MEPILKYFEEFLNPDFKTGYEDNPPRWLGKRIDFDGYSGYILQNYYRPFGLNLMWYYPSTNMPLSEDDIILAEKILDTKLKEYCVARWGKVPEALKNLKHYNRQYLGTLYENNRKIEINLLDKTYLKEIEFNQEAWAPGSIRYSSGRLDEEWIETLKRRIWDDDTYYDVQYMVLIDLNNKFIIRIE